MKWILKTIALLSLVSLGAEAKEYLIKLDSSRTNQAQFQRALSLAQSSEVEAKALGFNGWHAIELGENSPFSRELIEALKHEGLLQENFTYTYALQTPQVSNDILETLKGFSSDELQALGLKDLFSAPPDNPDFVKEFPRTKGSDPLLKDQWGMKDIGMDKLSMEQMKGEPIVVAVIDTGVDYTHPDLIENLWMNENEIPNNNIDDDGNGYVDDIYGWDFVSDDNKPYDFRVPSLRLLMGGNPGHGTHCAGNVAARGNNKEGIIGTAPFAKIMSIRFLGESGQGSSEGAVKSILYAVDNGAKVLSNLLGSSCKWLEARS